MIWQYQILKAETASEFEAILNAAGADGWEAVIGGYATGESTKVSLGQGMPASVKVGASVWTAVMKRERIL